MYRELIERLTADIGVKADPRHVEAWMRLDHGTLDGLSMERFRNEVHRALDCIDEATPEQSETLARSYGL